ncbi:hypothetical protein HKK52_07365 [Pseudomonas sp. ADAK2]|uniref:hypothetical protein n=1 Tax=Pseudomonas TaxID=286 RepID=UPI0014628F1C|nr:MULTISPECIES: hypothetical protein [unclassified Pseudomonas]QJI40744.1 hypothetical protein HKK53_07360 [Pseudomonas sp. ADAK7]QJI47048.1 hypothetical protein HKK52_07365 [Pseudomonas sp. ADAK2]
MYSNGKSGLCALLAGAVLLSGCTSIFQGKPYDFPKPDEPSATVRLKYTRGTSLDAITFNEKGCYAGGSSLNALADDFIESQVAVGKELVLTYENVVAGTICRIPFSFTPQAGAIYTVQAGAWSESKPGLLPIFTNDQYHCGINVVKKAGTQESVEPIQQLRIKTGFACLRFVK